ncbi:MAG: NADH-quinone oxidoreductase subunit NuoF [Syntrophobacterales bacterium]|nr:NADH-quinone oxidoreductase subunit NuoF [Syntrophobacterales bacterium]
MNEETEERVSELANLYPSRKSALMPALEIAQRKNNNFLSNEDIKEVAKIVGVPNSRAFGVTTYYTMYNTKPVGKYHLQVDTNIPGFLSGAYEIVEHLKKKLGIEVGGTTGDGLFTLSSVEDLGSCGTCPVVQVNDTYYENLTIEKVDELVESLKSGKMPEPDTFSNFGTECNILLKNRGISDATDITVYKKGGGYEALKKTFKMQPSEIVDMVKGSMIRGRGGAGFPAGVKWGFLPKDNSRPVYLICNADEGEPGTFKDRQIMQYDPHLMIEGIAISAYAIGAEKAFIYIRGEFRWIADILENAIRQAKKDGQLNHVDIVVHRGAGSYVCGEETALIESIEGKRGNPRVKPPFPANVGLYGSPTIVNNVETLSCVPFIVEKGVQEFKKIGTEGNFGPKLYGVSGHVNKPGVYEYPLGTSLKVILETAGGVKGNLKAVIVGGLSVPILKADEIGDLKMDYDSCAKAGTMLGSGGIMVINDTMSIPELALRTINFYAHECCGQCVPGREGSKTIKVLLGKLTSGEGTIENIDTILDTCDTIKGLTLCPTGDAFAMPIEAMVAKFRGEFEDLVKRG